MNKDSNVGTVSSANKIFSAESSPSSFAPRLSGLQADLGGQKYINCTEMTFRRGS